MLRYWEREFRSIRPTKSAKGSACTRAATSRTCCACASSSTARASRSPGRGSSSSGPVRPSRRGHDRGKLATAQRRLHAARVDSAAGSESRSACRTRERSARRSSPCGTRSARSSMSSPDLVVVPPGDSRARRSRAHRSDQTPRSRSSSGVARARAGQRRRVGVRGTDVATWTPTSTSSRTRSSREIPSGTAARMPDRRRRCTSCGNRRTRAIARSRRRRSAPRARSSSSRRARPRLLRGVRDPIAAARSTTRTRPVSCAILACCGRRALRAALLRRASPARRRWRARRARAGGARHASRIPTRPEIEERTVALSATAPAC